MLSFQWPQLIILNQMEQPMLAQVFQLLLQEIGIGVNIRAVSKMTLAVTQQISISPSIMKVNIQLLLSHGVNCYRMVSK